MFRVLVQGHDGGMRRAAGGPEGPEPEAQWLLGTCSSASGGQPEPPGAARGPEDAAGKRLELTGEDGRGATGSGGSHDATPYTRSLAC